VAPTKARSCTLGPTPGYEIWENMQADTLLNRAFRADSHRFPDRAKQRTGDGLRHARRAAARRTLIFERKVAPDDWRLCAMSAAQTG